VALIRSLSAGITSLTRPQFKALSAEIFSQVAENWGAFKILCQLTKS
jgi:hypothetical protein